MWEPNPSLGHRESDGKGNLLPREDQKAFIEWLVDPVVGESQAAYSRRTGISQTTLVKWKKDKHFRKAWEEAASEKHGGLDRVSAIMDAAYKKALEGDVKAMELYMKLIDRMTPDKHMVVTQNMAELPDAEVAKLAMEAIEAKSQ